LLALQRSQNPALFVYIYDSVECNATGEAGHWWLHESLKQLQKSYKARFGASLIVLEGEALEVLQKLVKKYQIHQILWNRLYSPEIVKRDTIIKKAFQEQSVGVETFNGHLLNEPWEVQNNSGQYFKVFTPYWRKAFEVYQSKKEKLEKLKSINVLSHQENLTFDFLPKKNWYQKFSKYWTPGEKAAQDQLSQYLKSNIDIYKEARDRPDLDQTSKLSPYLRFGEISPRTVVLNILKSKKLSASVLTYLSEIGWREFSYSLLYYSDNLASVPINMKFQKFPWRKSSKDLDLWKKGRTGIPLVDAAMRQIYEKGWMHNRLRMVVGSFLVKNLLLNWTLGERYFQETLLDYDEASNAAGWQWIAGCGADASPYFRVFNPILQSERFDPQAKFILQYLPQLQILQKPSSIFQPYLQEQAFQSLVNQNLYYEPLVDLKDSRNRALEAYQKIKQ
jgi:deoxyribodipyrimidine photo-lyase